MESIVTQSPTRSVFRSILGIAWKRAIIKSIDAVRRTFARWRQTRNDLDELDPHMLRDVGIEPMRGIHLDARSMETLDRVHRYL